MLLSSSCNTNSNNACSCEGLNLSNDMLGGQIFNPDQSQQFTNNYVGFMTAMYRNVGVTSANADNMVRGGRIRKDDLVAIINSLPADEEFVSFSFGRQSAELEPEGSENYGKTYVVFQGGTLNPCNSPLYQSGQRLIYAVGESGGFCPPRCDTGYIPLPNPNYPGFMKDIAAPPAPQVQ
jgi:hypothetical protein